MFAVSGLQPLVQYPVQYLLIGCGGICLIALWLCIIFWITRRKPVKGLATMKALPDQRPSLDSLKRKYLDLLAAIEQRFLSGELKNRPLHQELSLTVRLFVYEASGKPVQHLTLHDIERMRLPSLAELIKQYYPDEFDAIEHGQPQSAIAKAKEVVMQWV